MNSKNKLFAVARVATFVLLVMCLMGASNADAKKWYFGVGTGFTFMNAQGDQGMNVGSFGPVQAEFDLDPSDFQDLMETAFGFGGYATDGTWIIQSSFGMMKLGGEPAGTLPESVGGGIFTSEWSYDITVIQATLGYTAYRSKDFKFSFTPYTGFRYIKHELGADLTITQGASTVSASRGIDNNWTDVLIGAGISYVISPKLTWNFGADAGFGGSEGTYSFNTGFSWKPLNHWSFSPGFAFSSIEFVNGEEGDSDWYLYDANEFGAGISVLYHF